MAYVEQGKRALGEKKGIGENVAGFASLSFNDLFVSDLQQYHKIQTQTVSKSGFSKI
jgi:hypothetical protein